MLIRTANIQRFGDGNKRRRSPPSSSSSVILVARRISLASLTLYFCYCCLGSGGPLLASARWQPVGVDSLTAANAGIQQQPPRGAAAAAAAATSGPQRARHPHHAIYVNPNPSTRSGGHLIPTSHQQKRRASSTAELPAAAPGIGSTPSSIGKSEQSQLADWPFFKSLQSARNILQAERQRQPSSKFAQLHSIAATSNEPSRTAGSSGHQSVVVGSASGSSGNNVPPTKRPESAISSSAPSLVTEEVESTEPTEGEVTTTKSPVDGQQESTTTTTTTTTTPTTLTTTTTERLVGPAATAAGGSPQNELPSGRVSMVSRETATEMPLSSSTATPAAAATSVSRPNDPLFSPTFHSSVQQAVNRIAKMTADSMNQQQQQQSTTEMPPPAAGSNRPDNPEQKQPQWTAAKPQNSFSGPQPSGQLRSSLSLNVLFKNFGIHNLTNLDQILLRSTLRNETSAAAGGSFHKDRTLKGRREKGGSGGGADEPTAEQRIQINGFQLMSLPGAAAAATGGSENTSSDTSAADTPTTTVEDTSAANGANDDGGPMAECKIEYTMKHVNISLSNGDKGDYTCDYIIDRKLTTTATNGVTGAGKPATTNGANGSHWPLDASRVCKLQLTSEYFANSHETGACNGTYLAVGKKRFCYVRLGNTSNKRRQPTLNRVFDFPVDRDAFDVKMVHKELPRASTEPLASGGGSGDDGDHSDEGAQIHLEIKPLRDDNCLPAHTSGASRTAEPVETSSNVEYNETPNDESSVPSQSTTGRPTMSTGGGIDEDDRSSGERVMAGDNDGLPLQPNRDNGGDGTVLPAGSSDNKKPATGFSSSSAAAAATGSAGADRSSRAQTFTIIASPNPKRKFVLKLPHDKLPHPINNRFKVSQTFDVTSQPRLYSAAGGAAASDHQSAHSAAASTGVRGPAASHSDQLELCDGFSHISTVGQLTSPDYPRYYPANVSCSFVIKRASPAYCQLLLQFRDFDLINGPQQQHPAAETEEQPRGDQQETSGYIGPMCSGDYLQIGDTRYCNSDHMRSGRGFLVKYQQLPCETADDRSVAAARAVAPVHSGPDGGRRRHHQWSTAQTADLTSPLVSTRGTVAPPMQQPDFSLALKTATPSSLPSSSISERPAMSASSGTTASGQPAQQQQQQQQMAPTARSKLRPPLVAVGELLNQIDFNEKIMGAKIKTDGAHASRTTTTSSANSTSGTQTRPASFSSSSPPLMSMASTVSSSALVSVSRTAEPFAGSGQASSGSDQQQDNNQELVSGGSGDGGGSSSSSQVECNQVNNEPSFVIKSPSFPDSYANNLQCMYYVRRNSSQVCYVELHFIRFDLEADSDCRYDYLEINNVRLCGSLSHKTTRIYFFNEPLKVIKFKSDESSSKGGFLIRVDQLECGSSGSILRQSKQLAAGWPKDNQRSQSADSSSETSGQAQAGAELRTNSSSSSSTRTFEYDTVLSQRRPAPAGDSDQTSTGDVAQVGPRPTVASSSGGSNSQRLGAKSEVGSGGCDEILYGKEATIKSPLWPESYHNDDSINGCRYTLVRDTLAKNKICQLELRFVNLRLGVSDCIDIDGYELLCGFNTRNMVKYYPFDRQAYLTISFFTGAAKFRARSLGGGASSSSSAAAAASVDPSNDLLPTRMPLRFMIIARQHECIDGFLAPQPEGASSLSSSSSLAFSALGYNQTNLLYSNGGGSSNLSPALQPRYANRTTSSSSLDSRTQQQPVASSKSDSHLLKYDFSRTTGSLGPSSSRRRPSSSSSSALLGEQPASNATTATTSNLIAAGCSDGSIVSRTSSQLYSANYPRNYNDNSHCLLLISRETSSVCHLELEFLDVDLDSSSASHRSICEWDYLQINYGERYCNMEQVARRLGPKQQLLVPFERANDHKVAIVFHSDSAKSRRGFLLRYRQVPCSLGAVTATQDERPAQPTGVTAELKPLERVSLMQLGGAGARHSVDRSPQQQEQQCLIQFTQYNGIISSNNILSKLRTSYPFKSDCDLRLKLLPGYCRAQLSFGEFELQPRLGDYCLEFLELDGFRYCGHELKNTTRFLSISEPTQQRSINLRYSTSNISNIFGFRAVFKQIECMPEPLKPLGGSQSPSASQTDATDTTVKQQHQQQATGSLAAAGRPLTSTLLGGASGTAAGSSGARGDQAERVSEGPILREFPLKSEFFELNSRKLALTSGDTDTYEPNMFVVHRIKKISADVCKLRLMFYQFDLEPSVGCRRDFLDINNVDRLCGQLDKPEETRRDYDWPGERDFLISFVSDSSFQKRGFLIFGQQLYSPSCSSSSNNNSSSGQNQPPHQQQQQPPTAAPTFDEEQPSNSNRQLPPQQTPVDAATVDAEREQQHHQKVAVATKEAHRDGTRGSNMSTNSMDHHQMGTATRQPQQGSSGSDGGCLKLHYEDKFELASPGWPQKYAPQSTCFYLVHKAASNVCSVTFNVVSMILGPEEFTGSDSCDTSSSKDDYLEIGDGKSVVLCGLISRPRVITVDFEQRQFFTVKFQSNSASGFGFFIEARQNKCGSQSTTGASVNAGGESATEPKRTGGQPNMEHAALQQPEAPSKQQRQKSQGPDSTAGSGSSGGSCNQLLVDEWSSIESDNFPRHYSHQQNCLVAVRRSNQSVCAVDLIMNHFDLEPASELSGACENDYLEIDYSRFCGRYPQNHRLRFNYFNDELDKLIRFHTDAAGARPGFSLTVRQVSGGDECDSPPSSVGGEKAPPAPLPKAPQSSSSAQQENDEIISYLPDTTAPTSTASASQMTTSGTGGMESGASQARGRNQSLAVVSGSSSSSTREQPALDPNTLCQFVYHSQRQYLVSPNYNERRPHYDNNIDCLYKIVASSYDICSLRLQLIDLDLEQSSNCHNDYLLIDSQRYCGHNKSSSSSSSGTESPIEVQFSATLPREIHLRYHTSAHTNEGRGFKLLYEQRPCDGGDGSAADGVSGPNVNRQSGDDEEDGNNNSKRRTRPSSSAAERQSRRMHFGQLSYPKNYVSSGGGSSTDMDQHHHLHQLQQQQPQSQRHSMLATATATNNQRASNSVGPQTVASHARWYESRQLTAQQPQQLGSQPSSLSATVIRMAAAGQGRPLVGEGLRTGASSATAVAELDEQHDGLGLTLRKEIVVAKSAAPTN